MKLLMCCDCGTIFNLVPNILKSCDCKKVKGMYDADGRTAVTNGQGFALAVGNGSLLQAIVKAKSLHPAHDRLGYFDLCQFYAWARPHEGPGNPHSRVNPDL